MYESVDARPLVMIVEDDSLIAEAVQARLEREAIETVIASGYVEALELLRTRDPSLLVLDVVLGDGTGYDLCRALRGTIDSTLARLVDIPVVMLTAFTNEQDCLASFQAGADDYLNKPFNLDELAYRIFAILRRSNGAGTTKLSAGPLSIDLSCHTVKAGNKMLDLTPKEFNLLRLLVSQPGRVFSRKELCKRVWGYTFLGNSRTVDVHVNRLRQKLTEYVDLGYIETEWGIGYKFVHSTGGSMLAD